MYYILLATFIFFPRWKSRDKMKKWVFLQQRLLSPSSIVRVKSELAFQFDVCPLWNIFKKKEEEYEHRKRYKLAPVACILCVFLYINGSVTGTAFLVTKRCAAVTFQFTTVVTNVLVSSFFFILLLRAYVLSSPCLCKMYNTRFRHCSQPESHVGRGFFF